MRANDQAGWHVHNFGHRTHCMSKVLGTKLEPCIGWVWSCSCKHCPYQKPLSVSQIIHVPAFSRKGARAKLKILVAHLAELEDSRGPFRHHRFALHPNPNPTLYASAHRRHRANRVPSLTHCVHHTSEHSREGGWGGGLLAQHPSTFPISLSGPPHWTTRALHRCVTPRREAPVGGLRMRRRLARAAP